MNTSEETKEIALDIGTGEKHDKFFIDLAMRNPNKTYLVISPQVEEVSKLKNLHSIKWKSDIDSKIPLSPESVNEIYLYMLYGVLRTKQNILTTDYQDLLKDAHRVLKGNGTLHVVDCFSWIKKLIEEEGFRITKENKVKTKDKRTKTIELLSVGTLVEFTAKKATQNNGR